MVGLDSQSLFLITVRATNTNSVKPINIFAVETIHLDDFLELKRR